MSLKKIFIILPFMTVLLISCNEREGVLEVSGRLEGKEISISSKLRGNIQSVRIDEGQNVKYSDTLVIIEHRTYDLQLENAEAILNIARNELKSALKNYETVKKDRERLLNIYREGSVSEKQIDDMENKYTHALTVFSSARANLKSAGARYEMAKETAGDCFITSPINGVVTEKIFEEGEFVNPGGSLLTITVLDPIYLKAYVPEKELGKVRLNSSVNVIIDSYPERTFEGTITFISNRAEFTPGNIQTREERIKQVFEIKIRLPNSKGIMKPGMPADALIPLQQ